MYGFWEKNFNAPDKIEEHTFSKKDVPELNKYLGINSSSKRLSCKCSLSKGKMLLKLLTHAHLDVFRTIIIQF